MLNLSRKMIKLCDESLRVSDGYCRRIFEGFISNKFNIQYSEEQNNEYPYSVEFPNTLPDRLEFIKNTIQDNIDSNTWNIKSEEVDNTTLVQKLSSANGELVIYRDNRTNNPTMIMFTNRGESDEFFNLVSDYNLPDLEQEEEEDEFSDEEDNPMTPEGFAMRNENPDGTVNSGESANGDDEGSLNIA